MAPPYERAYDYFRWDAEDFIQNNRPTWTVDERKRTIATIWAGSQAVKTHYAPCKGRRRAAPLGLPAPNPIPVAPYTQADVVHARGSGTMPVLVPPPVVPVPPLAPAVALAPQTQTAAIQTIVVQAERSVDTLPYNFWPQLPWPAEPTLPHMDVGRMKNNEDDYESTWLATKPHQRPEEEELTWHGVRILGKGGYGAAGLWVQLDDTNHISDNMVIKETKNMDARYWRDPKNWRDNLPQEIRIHQLIEKRRAAEPEMCRHLVHMRAHRLFMRQRKYRLYLDLYAGGSLWHAMGHHDTNWSRELLEGRDEDSFLPEIYIWYIIKVLAEACMILQKGTTADEAIDGWRPITHLDLQPTNVLLSRESGQRAHNGDANETIPPLFPVLTDLGISFFSPDNNDCPLPDNPENYTFDSIEPAYPPELQIQFPPDTIPLGEKTDIWGIGRIAWTLIVNRRTNYGPVREKRDGDPNDFEGFVPLSIYDARNLDKNNRKTTLRGRKYFPAARNYSDELRTMVRACLNFDGDERPSLEEIRGAAVQVLREDGEAEEDLMDVDGLGLELPGLGEFQIGEPFELKKRRHRDSEESLSG